MKGGVGKSTLAINVADCLGRDHGQKVALIDVDPQFNATQCLIKPDDYVRMLQGGIDTVLDLFDTAPAPTTSVLRGSTPSTPRPLEEIELQEFPTLDLLPGNIDLYRLEMVNGEGREFAIKRFIERNLKPNEYDFVIIDTPPTPSAWMTSALLASDHYIIPVKPDPLSLIGIDLLRGIIERRRTSYNLDIECLGIVLTMVERPDSIVFENAKANLRSHPYWNQFLFAPYLSKRASYSRHQLTQPYILVADDYEMKQQLRAIVRKILGELT